VAREAVVIANPTLRALVREGRGTGPHLLVTGGVHGDEFEPMAAVRRLAGALGSMPFRGRVTLVPVVNESAWELGRRCGEDGLDLARTCPGRPDGSITERAAHALSTLIRTADAYVDLHSGGTVATVLPLAGYTLHPDPSILGAQRRLARAFNLPIIWGTNPQLEGRSLSVARDAGVPAIYAEYRGGGTCDPAGVTAYAEGCLNVMASLGMIDRPIPPSRIEHVVEDGRPGSGHMQAANPSPMDGFFDPCVALGDRVSPGARLGSVCSETGDQVETVVAGETGIVIVLRTFPSVRRGESVAVILPMEP
jgi:predicted deacylase